MIREAIEKIVDLSGANVIDIEGKSFLIAKDGNRAEEIFPKPEFADTLNLYSLKSLVQMIKTEAVKKYNPPLYVSIHSHDHVECYTQPLKELRNERRFLYSAIAKDIPGWREDIQLSFEEALIAIRTRFQQTPDSDYLLKLLSDITNGAKITFTDNGIASTVVSQKGIALRENAIIRPIVNLKPYRTFQEVEQPESSIHIRVSEKGIRFIEADGGMWRLAARRTIAEYLKSELLEVIASEEVIVTI
jgi:hypothetical protein